MDSIVVRRVKLANHPHRADYLWFLFEEGKLTNPTLILTDHQMTSLIEQVTDQDEGKQVTYDGE